MRAVALMLALSGCSFAFTANPPPPCASSAVAPVADTALAVVASLAAIHVATGDDGTTAGALVGVAALGSAASAYIGYRRVSRCRDAKAGVR